METRLDGLVDSAVKSWGLAATQAHIRDGTLVGGFPCSLELGECDIVKPLGLLCSPDDTGNDVGHGSGAVGAEDLDSDQLGRLCNTILARRDGTST
jgi:hypothetical protein